MTETIIGGTAKNSARARRRRLFVLAALAALPAGAACGRTELYSLARARGSGGATGAGGIADGGLADATGSDGDDGGIAGAPGTGGTPRPPCGPLIDDMEDGSGRICAGAGRVGVWYAFNDGFGTQWPTPTTPGVPIETALIPGGGRAGSRRAMRTYGQKLSSWGGGIGVDLAFDGAAYGLYDARAYSGVTFWARSEAPLTEIHVRLSTATTALAAYDGTCAGYPNCVAPAEVVVMPTTEWKPYWVPFSHLRDAAGAPLQADKLINIQFLVRDGGAVFDFWIDNLSFYAGEPGCCPNPAPACAGAIRFGDPQLDRIVRTLIGKPDDDVACSDLCAVYSLSPYSFLYSPGIASLDGFQCLTNLGSLSISASAITDVTPLAGLTELRRLVLNQGALVELPALGALGELVELDLSHNQIRDLRGLSGLGAVQRVDVSGNQIQWGLSDDLTPLAGLTSLDELDLSANQIESVAPLARLSSLAKLNLWSNQIEDVAPLAGLSGLGNLTLAYNRIQDLRPLAPLTALAWLDLDNNPISDVGPLGSLKGLTSLDLSATAVGDLGPLAGLPALATLGLGSCNLGSVAALARLTGLTWLSLDDNLISDLAPLSGLRGLASLDLSSNLVSDLAGLTPLTRLTFVDLADNRIETVAPLDANPGLAAGAIVLLAGNPIDCQGQAANLSALRTRGVVIDPQPARGASPVACPP